MMFILAASSLIPMFALGDLNWESFGIVLVLYAVTFWSFEGLAQAFSCFPNVIYGLFMFLNIYFMAFLFCSMFVDPEDVVWPIRVFCYFLPLGWTLQSYMYGLWHHMDNHKGVTYCTPGDALPHGGVCTAQGFYCYSEEDPSGAVCYGKTGDEILESLSVQFTIFEADGHYARNIGIIRGRRRRRGPFVRRELHRPRERTRNLRRRALLRARRQGRPGRHHLLLQGHLLLHPGEEGCPG